MKASRPILGNTKYNKHLIAFERPILSFIKSTTKKRYNKNDETISLPYPKMRYYLLPSPCAFIALVYAMKPSTTKRKMKNKW